MYLPSYSERRVKGRRDIKVGTTTNSFWNELPPNSSFLYKIDIRRIKILKK